MFAAAALPVGAVYALLLAVYTDWFPGRASAMALMSTLSACALSVPVWWLSGRIHWPDRLKASFYLVHAALAVLFAASWVSIDVLTTQLLFSPDMAARKLAALGWEALLGSWLYGQAIGMSYALRAQGHLRTERETAAKLANLAVEAQLRALRAQLNPHFLFNALHSLSALVHVDANAADEAIDRLGALLRYAISSGDQTTASLERELSFANDYIALEQLRLGARLVVLQSVNPEALELDVPVFTLQPLLENAVRHGIDPRPEGGVIRLDIHFDGASLVITVADDGVGAREDAVASASGLGLRALRERLSLSGRPHTLKVETREGQGFSVQLVLAADA